MFITVSGVDVTNNSSKDIVFSLDNPNFILETVFNHSSLVKYYWLTVGPNKYKLEELTYNNILKFLYDENKLGKMF